METYKMNIHKSIEFIKGLNINKPVFILPSPIFYFDTKFKTVYPMLPGYNPSGDSVKHLEINELITTKTELEEKINDSEVYAACFFIIDGIMIAESGQLGIRVHLISDEGLDYDDSALFTEKKPYKKTVVFDDKKEESSDLKETINDLKESDNKSEILNAEQIKCPRCTTVSELKVDGGECPLCKNKYDHTQAWDEYGPIHIGDQVKHDIYGDGIYEIIDFDHKHVDVKVVRLFNSVPANKRKDAIGKLARIDYEDNLVDWDFWRNIEFIKKSKLK
jgi:hypothetical protein